MDRRTSLSSSGNYVVLGILGQGGMGRVYLGRMTTGAGFSRLVAIKQIHPHLADDSEVVGRFLDEARLSSQVRHANVVSTLDVIAKNQRGAGTKTLSLIQEYVEGAALSTLLTNAIARKEPVPIPIALSIAIGILRGLAATHDATNEQGEPLQIVHRDVSPQNVLVGVDGVARITDFGVARGAGRLVVTEDGGIRGKLRYMAPEQLKSGTQTRQVDIYAAGAVLWEMLAGARLVSAKDEAAVIATVLHGDLPRVSTRRPEVSPELDAIVARSLSSDVTERYATASEMAAALSALAPASLDEVAAFVRDLAREELLERQGLVRSEAETDDFRPLDEVLANLERETESVMPVRVVVPDLTTARPVERSRANEPARKTPLESIALVVVIALGVVMLWRALSPSEPEKVAPAAAAPVASVSLAPPPSAAPAATPVATSVTAAPVVAPAPERRVPHPRPRPATKEKPSDDPRDRP